MQVSARLCQAVVVVVGVQNIHTSLDPAGLGPSLLQLHSLQHHTYQQLRAGSTFGSPQNTH